MMDKFVKSTYILGEMGLKDGCFIGCFFIPEGNWPIEKFVLIGRQGS